jgi:hypothetical protein
MDLHHTPGANRHAPRRTGPGESIEWRHRDLSPGTPDLGDGAKRHRICGQLSTTSTFTTLAYSTDALTTTAVDVSTLLANTTYYWHVRALNANGASAWSTSRSFTTAAETTVTAPTTSPMLLTPMNSAIGVSRSPIFSWNAVTRATAYKFQLSTSSLFSTTVVNTTYTSTSVQLSSLSANTLYYWRVAGTNSSGTGPWSSVWVFRTEGTLSAPALSSPVNGAIGQSQPITLGWIPVDASSTTTYVVQVATSSSFLMPVFTREGITAETIQLPTLSRNSRFYWRVKARTPSGDGPWSSVWYFSTAM